ncbi:MAG: hypothetical protein ACRC7O_18665 [Fimbriiglobus sp.]
MPGRRFAQRLAGVTNAALNRMAWRPSALAPHPRELLDLAPPPVLPADPTEALAMCGARDIVFADGVPVAASLTGRGFVSLGEQLFRVVPSLREVRLVAVDPVRGELPGCPHLAHLERLSVAGCRLGPDAVRLAASPFLRGLVRFDLSRNDLDDAAVGEIAGIVFPRLREFDVRFNPITAVGRKRLADSPHLGVVFELGRGARGSMPADEEDQN